MGLDQYLYARNYYSSYSTNTDLEDFHKLMEISKVAEYAVPDDTWVRSVLLSVKVGQWRKAHQIHQWFVENRQDGVDDCREAYVPRESLEELLELCKEVSADHDKARTLLPFGWSNDEDYGDHYYNDIDYTINLITHVLTMPDTWEFYYNSSW